MDYTKIVQEEDYLEHHGIKGQKWGIRRYQNADGSLTEEGRRRYDIKEAKIKAKADRAVARAQVKSAKLNAKTEKITAKNLKKASKVQTKILKMEMKAAKKEAAYARGKAFGESFASSFGRGFGQQFGEGVGKTFGDWQKWKELRNTAYSNKTARMEKELAKIKYDKGFNDRTLGKEETASKAALQAARANMVNALNKNKELDLQLRRFERELREAEKKAGGNP